jgi:hypothetical protein
MEEIIQFALSSTLEIVSTSTLREVSVLLS